MIILVFLGKIFGGMGFPAYLSQHVWKLDHFSTFSYDCSNFDHFQKIFLVKFLIIFLAMLLLIFKSLFEIVAWKCQIVKIWSFLEEQDVVTLFCFFNFLETDDYFLTTPWFATFCQICASFHWTCPKLKYIV